MVTLTTCSNIRKFCKFMLADIPNRAGRLRSLTLRPRKWGANLDKLPSLFTHAQGLRHLSLHQFSTLHDALPNMAPVLSTLPHLSSLELRNVWDQLTVWHGFSFPAVRTLTLREVWFSRRRLPEILAPFPHLEVFRLRDHDTDLEVGVEPEPEWAASPESQTQWPTMRHLALRECQATVGPFVHAFPGLRTLTLRDLDDPPEEADQHMAACWDTLDTVYMRVADFDECKIPCPVRVLILQDDYMMSLGHDSPLRSIRRMSPVVLVLAVDEFDDLDFLSGLHDAAPRLRCLDLTVLHRGAMSSFGLLAWVVSLEYLLSYRVVGAPS